MFSGNPKGFMIVGEYYFWQIFLSSLNFKVKILNIKLCTLKKTQIFALKRDVTWRKE